MEHLDLSDYVIFSVGDLKKPWRGLTGVKDGVVYSLDTIADNIAVLDRLVGGDDARWMMLKDATSIPHDRKWTAVSILIEADNISIARKYVEKHAIDTTGFEGRVDYVLLNLLKTRQMVVIACFDHDGDAVLHRMRQESCAAISA